MPGVLPEGLLFAQRYRIVRRIAAGAMGAVYEVEHLETARRRALKVMHPHILDSEALRERFQLEARIAGGIESEHVVDVVDAGIDEATQSPFMVMELLRGEDLGARLKRTGKLPVEEALTYLLQAASALALTHAASIVHRDLKPANLFLTLRPDGTPRLKIIDFGVAKIVSEGISAAEATQNVGTPMYMAPEQLTVSTKLSGATDIYALGLVAFTLLVGVPYWAPEASAASASIAFALIAIRGPQESAVRRAAAAGVVLPAAFDAWFARMTALDPGARYQSAPEAVSALHEVLLGHSPNSSRTPLPLGAPHALATPLPIAMPQALTASQTLAAPRALATPLPIISPFPTGVPLDGTTTRVDLSSTSVREWTTNLVGATAAGPVAAPPKRGLAMGPKVVGMGFAVGLLVSALWWVTQPGSAETTPPRTVNAVSPEGAPGLASPAATTPTAATPAPTAPAPGDGAQPTTPGTPESSAGGSLQAGQAGTTSATPPGTAAGDPTQASGAPTSGHGAQPTTKSSSAATPVTKTRTPVTSGKLGTSKKDAFPETSSLLGRD
ncbi:serine/threonine protein kinase [Chondromyces apiculatus]|uniref:Protein kinase domain-containing protein n=1 Tax=Chondromyces apiculatus DSM 436 TaxID=1192034 RepID=A0A017T3E0_9BACT|nr:serine/threonine protein kinase [Chondromyces apiculatus]EYF03774.1 Hypothetical protein CAP_5204 [Chondromyces apiculatus DSM 436]